MMAKQGTSTVAPRLRFPEFRKAEGWKTKPMSELYSFVRNNALSRDKLNYEGGAVKNIHYGDIHTKFPALFDITKERVPYINDSEEVPVFGSEDYCVEGDLIFADASEDTDDVGKSMEVVRLGDERLLSGQHTILARRRDDSFIMGFGGHLFRSGHIRSQIKQEAQGTKVYAISSSRLGNVEVTYPIEKAEQRKIADCLTSLDEVIAAQGRKVEALKAHKRGLMQQLFPREGETRPRLRFLEFSNAPQWQERLLKEVVGSVKTGKLDANAMVDDGQYRFYTCAKNHYRIDKYAFDGEALLIAGNGAYLGYIHHYTGKFNAYQRTYVLQDFSINVAFLKCFLDRNFPSRIALEKKDGNTPYIVLATITDMQILIPRDVDEQKCIADCLSSLDTQIAAESHRLAALKTHKQGLMQQLFPAPEGN